MKKTISACLSICMLLCCLLSAGAAAASPSTVGADGGDVVLRLFSDVAGRTEADADAFIEIVSGPVVLFEGNDRPVIISDYVGASYHDALTAGREYSVTYTLAPADGYALPETLSEDDVAFECGKGVSVYYCKVIELVNVHSAEGGPRTTRVLRVIASVVVDGNPLQRIIGWIKDIILKISYWSLY